MYCQSCGAQIADDAKFCNICGARIAEPGSPGGLLSQPPPEPVASPGAPQDDLTRRGRALKGTRASLPEPEKASPGQPSSPPAPPRAVSAPVKVTGDPAPGPAPKKPATMVMGSEVVARMQQAVAEASPAAPSGNLGEPAAAPRAPREHPSPEALAAEASAPVAPSGAEHAAPAPDNVWQPEGSSAGGHDAGASSISMERIGLRSPVPWWALAVAATVLFGCALSGIAWSLWGVAFPGEVALESADKAEPTGSGDVPGDNTVPPPAPSVSEVEPALAEVEPPATTDAPRAPRTRPPGEVSPRRPTPRNRPSGTSRSPSGPTKMSEEPAPSEPAPSEPDPSPPNSQDPEPGELSQTTAAYLGRVRYVVRRYYAARAQSCFEHASRNSPSTRGSVTVRLHIGASGQVTSASVTRNTTGNDALGRCLLGRVGSWRFPAPPDGEEIVFDLPFSG